MVLAFKKTVRLYNNSSKVKVADVSWNNKNDGNGNSNPVGLSELGRSATPTALEVSEVSKNCVDAQKKGRLMSESQKMTFEDTSVDSKRAGDICAWGVDGNSEFIPREPINGFVVARYEQAKSVFLPAGAVLCDFEISTNMNKFRYDDIFVFTLSSYVLAANLDRALPRFQSQVMKLVNNQSVQLKKYSREKRRASHFLESAEKTIFALENQKVSQAAVGR